MAATLREYLVSLGAEVDQKSFNKFKAALAGSAKTVASVTGVLAALTAVLVKTSLSLDDTTQKYEAMSKQAHKTTEEIRAQETALKVLGKTMDEVKADERLKEQYENLSNLAKQMSLPGASKGVLSLRKMVDTVNELRVVGAYAMQWINHYMLNRIKAPMDEMRRGLDRIKTDLKVNLPTWTKRIGDFLGNFLRLVGAGANGIKDVIKLVKQLPDGIKQIGAAIAGAFTMSQMGGLGWALTGLGALLMLLDDFYTYKRGGLSAFPDFWKSLEEGSVGEKLIQGLGNVIDGALNLGTNICEKIKQSIIEFDWEKAGTDLGQVFTTLFTTLTGILDGTGGGSAFNLLSSAGALVSTIFVKISEAISSFVTSTEWGNMLAGAIDAGGNFISGIVDIILGNKEGKTPEELGIAGSIVASLQKIVNAIGEALGKVSFTELGVKFGGFFSEIITKIGGYFTKNEGEEKLPIESMMEGGENVISKAANGIMDFFLGALAGVKFKDVGAAVGNFLSSFVTILKDGLLNGITALTGDKKDQGLAGKMITFVKELIRGLTEALKEIPFDDIGTNVGDFITQLYTKISTFFSNATQEQEENGSLLGTIEEAGKAAANAILDALLGFMSGLDGTQIGTAISDTVKNIFKLITGALSGEFDAPFEETEETIGDKAGELAAGILTKIAEVLGSIDAPGILVQAKEAAVALWGKIKEGLAFVNTIGGDMMESIVTGLTGVTKEDWEEALGADNVWIGGFAAAIGTKLVGGSTGASILTGILSALAAADQSDQGLAKAWEDIKLIGGSIWTKITEGFSSLQAWWDGPDGAQFKEDVNRIAGDIADTIFGKKGEDGKRTGGIWDTLVQMFNDLKDNPVLEEIEEKIRSAFVNAFTGLWEAVSPLINDLWYNIVNSMPGALKWLFGVQDVTKKTQNDGYVTYESTNGRSYNVSTRKDENGVSNEDVIEKLKGFFPGGDMFEYLDTMVLNNGRLPKGYASDVIAALMKGDPLSLEYLLRGANLSPNKDGNFDINAWYDKYRENRSAPEGYTYNYSYGNGTKKTTPLTSSSSSSGAPDINAIWRKAYEDRGLDVPSYLLPPDSASVQAAHDSAQSEANKNPITFSTVIETPGGGTTNKPDKQAHGGFFGKPTYVEVGDDGEEAIIPMTNPSRAKGLLQQMFARMGSASRDILASLGASGAGPGIGGPGMPASMQPAAMFPAAGGGTITSNSGNTVSAPTTINVYGSGDPLAAGNAAAKASENNIVRRVRGCFE